MLCPFCSHPENQVIDSRISHYNQIPGIRRRRVCLQCNKRFSSFEMTINDLEGVEPATLDGILEQIIKLFKDAPVTNYKALPAPPLKVDSATRCEEPSRKEKKVSSVPPVINGNSIKDAMRRARQKYIDELDASEFDEEDFD